MGYPTPRHSDTSLVIAWARRLLLANGMKRCTSTDLDSELCFGPQTPTTTGSPLSFGTGRREKSFSCVDLIIIHRPRLTLLPSPLKRLENERRKAIQFLDEHRIIVWEDDDNFLDVYDTSHPPEVGWVFGNRALRLGLPDTIYFDVKMHSGSHHGSKPVHLEGVVPFFVADSAKIMVVNVITDSDLTKEAVGTSVVLFIEDILRAVQAVPFGTVVPWEGWREMTASFGFKCSPSQTEDERQCFVAGSRFISPPLDCDLPGFRRLEVFDFNPHYIRFAQAAGQQHLAIMECGGLKYIKSQMVVPWREEKQSIIYPLVHLTEDHVIIEDVSVTSHNTWFVLINFLSPLGHSPRRAWDSPKSAFSLELGSDDEVTDYIFNHTVHDYTVFTSIPDNRITP